MIGGEVFLNIKIEKKGFGYNIRKYGFIYFLMLPGLLYFLIFHYIPMYGIVIAFQDFYPFQGIRGMILDPNWVGFKHFSSFFDSFYFWRIIRNTLLIYFYKLLLTFPAAIMLALLLNEVPNKKFKKVTQTISYLPHFLSWVIVAGVVSVILSPSAGIVNEVIKSLGRNPIIFMADKRYFRGVIVLSDLWRSVGWSSIIYLSALASIDPSLYESAYMDGANRLQKTVYITIPSIISVAIIILILSIGGILNAGFEQILLMYSPAVYEVGDIIDTYVYREGLINFRYSFASAMGLFKNVIGLIMVATANYLAKRYGDYGIW